MALNPNFKEPTAPGLLPVWLLCIGLVLIASWRFFIASNLPLSVDEAYYVAWSKSPDWGYWTKPPLIAWAIGGARMVCGESIACIRSTALIGFPLTSLVLAVLAWRMGESLKSACLVAFLFATIPLSSFYGIAATTDTFLLLMWASAMLCLWLALHGRFWAWPMLGLAFGLGMLAKYTMVVFGISALLILLHPQWRSHWKTWGPYLALLVAVVVFSPNVVWNLTHQMPTFQHTANITHGAKSFGLYWDSLASFLAQQVLIGNPFLVCFFLLAAFRFAKSAPSATTWFSLSAAVPMLCVICGQALMTRAYANWAAPAYLGVCLLAVSHMSAHSRKISLSLALAFNIVFAVVLYHYQALVATPFQLKDTAASDPFWALRNWPKINEQVAQELAAGLPKPQWRIASEDRAVLAQAQMGLVLKPGQALGWQRDPNPENHFEQHFPLKPGTTEPVLLITKVSRDDVLQAFPKATWIREIRSDQMPADALVFQLWWLKP